MSGFAAECALCVALVLANNGGLLEDVHTSGEAFQGLGDLLRRVEGLGVLEDVLAAGQSLQRLAPSSAPHATCSSTSHHSESDASP